MSKSKKTRATTSATMAKSPPEDYARSQPHRACEFHHAGVVCPISSATIRNHTNGTALLWISKTGKNHRNKTNPTYELSTWISFQFIELRNELKIAILQNSRVQNQTTFFHLFLFSVVFVYLNARSAINVPNKSFNFIKIPNHNLTAFYICILCQSAGRW